MKLVINNNIELDLLLEFQVVIIDSISNFKIFNSKRNKVVSFLFPTHKLNLFSYVINFDGNEISKIKNLKNYESLGEVIVSIIKDKFLEQNEYVFLINTSGLNWIDINYLISFIKEDITNTTIKLFLPKKALKFVDDFEKIKVIEL